MKSGDKSAFPTEMGVHTAFGSTKRAEIGLTKREHYAGLAMQGLLANPQYWKRVYKTLSSLKANKDSIECVFAQFSIKLADEILQQLENK